MPNYQLVESASPAPNSPCNCSVTITSPEQLDSFLERYSPTLGQEQVQAIRRIAGSTAADRAAGGHPPSAQHPLVFALVGPNRDSLTPVRVMTGRFERDEHDLHGITFHYQESLDLTLPIVPPMQGDSILFTPMPMANGATMALTPQATGQMFETMEHLRLETDIDGVARDVGGPPRRVAPAPAPRPPTVNPSTWAMSDHNPGDSFSHGNQIPGGSGGARHL